MRAGHRVLTNGAPAGSAPSRSRSQRPWEQRSPPCAAPANAELARSLGAAHVIDYTTDDFTAKRAGYDVILDNVGNRPLGRLRRALTPAGTLVLNGGGSPGHVIGPVGAMLRAAVVNGLVRQRLRFLPTRQDRVELAAITGLIEGGKLTPVLDRTYPLAEAAEGLRHMETGHARGKAVITVT